MALTSAELQLLQSLQQKQLAEVRQTQFTPPPVPQIPIPQQAFDLSALNNIIDQKVSERLQAMQVQAQQPQIPVQAAPPMQPKPPQEQAPMLTLKSQDKAVMDKLRPLLMAALTLEQKGRLAELAFAVHSQANSTEHAYRVGFD